MNRFKGEAPPGHRRPWIAYYDDQVPASLEYPSQTCHQLLSKAAEKWPDNPCTLYKDRVLTFSEIDQITSQLASGLHRLGLRFGGRVGLLMPNIPQFVYSFFAVLKAGGVVVAMNPQSTGPEIALQAAETRLNMVMTLKTIYPVIKRIQPQTGIRHIIVTTIEEGLLPAAELLAGPPAAGMTDTFEGIPRPDFRLREILSTEIIQLPDVSPGDPAIFQYTGGTTGTPKAAVGLHRNLTANTCQFRKWLWNLEDGKEILLAAIPMFHVYGMVLCLNLAMAMGAALLLVPSMRSLDEVLEEITIHKPGLFPGVPGLFLGLMNHPGLQQGKYRLDSLKVCISGAAPLPPEVKRGFEKWISGRLVEGYGLSEAPTATHCNPVGGNNITGSIGLPLPDVDCMILSLDDGKTELEPGETGELVVSGPQVMQGYYQNPAETGVVLSNGWLFTGDIARMDDHGYFYILDRKKDLIKVNGLQVWPHEVEEVLALHPSVHEVGVAGVPDKLRGEAVKAWIVTRPGQSIIQEEVTEWCGRSLSRYKIPSQIDFLPELPRTPMGKLLRRELKKLPGSSKPE